MSRQARTEACVAPTTATRGRSVLGRAQVPHEEGTSAQQLPPAGPSEASPASRAGPEVDTLQTLGQGQVRKGLRLPSGERERHRGWWLVGRPQRGAAAPSPSSRARPCPPGSGSLLPDSPFQSPEPRAVNRSRPHTLVSCSGEIQKQRRRKRILFS